VKEKALVISKNKIAIMAAAPQILEFIAIMTQKKLMFNTWHFGNTSPLHTTSYGDH